MDFPHLSDTQFPHVDNIDVYKYQNNFQYERWQGKVSFKLLNVLWNSNYADVPYFDTDAKRDEWFDSQHGYVGTLESLFNNTPENTVKIPIPYNDAYNYNYLVVDMPMQTSEAQPINYENKNIRVKRWFYFIEDMVQTAPSTTELYLAVDYWTTFINSVEIPYLMLERGHAPMSETTVEQFLANPIANNEYLLADDFNYGKTDVIQTSTYVPIGNGTKYVLFCAPYESSDFALFDSVEYSGNSTPPTYSDINNRWGYQLQVNDYEWKYGDTDYSGANLPIKNQNQDGLLNGCKCYAIEGRNAKAFFNYCAKYCVHFLHGIQAMFILDESLFTKDNSISFKGYTLYEVSKKNVDLNVTFNKAQFGFENRYANIAKLYTFPYSSLEITDDEGNSFTARIENCGNVQMHQEVSLVYPYLNYNVFFSGINGNGTMNYTWKNINGTNVNKQMWGSDFSKFMVNWNIPTYALFVSAEDEYAANNFFNVKARRAGAIKDYENAVRYANTTYENTADTFDTNTNNVAASGATNTTNTANVGNTMNTNQGIANQANTDITAQNVTTSKDNCEVNRLANLACSHYNGAKLSDDAVIDIQTSQTIVGLNNTAAAITTANNNACSVGATSVSAGAGMLSGLVSGGPMQGLGAVFSGAGSIVGSGFNAQTATVNTAIAITTDSNVTAAVCNATAAKTNNAIQNIDVVTLENNNAMVDCVDNTCDAMTNNTATNNASNAAQTANTVATNNTNAVNLQNTNNANAVRTQNTETANADYNRDATVAAEKANLVQKQLEAENMYKNARLQRPAEYSSYGGDYMPDVYQRRGVRLNIRTQTKAAISQAGDAFLRFGYALHRVWNMSQGFHYCKNFTFWKAEDIWINDGSGVANVATNIIGDILLKGVTVWRDPEKIGTVGIYDNI